MGKQVQSSSFTTNEIAPNKRFDTYRDSMGVVFDASKPGSTGRDFFAKIKSYLLGEVMLIECATTAQRFERPSTKIAKDGLDHFLVQVFTKGHTIRRGDPANTTGKPGDIVVIDASHPWIANNNEFHNLTLVIPRRILADKLISEHNHHGRIISARRPLGRILRDFTLSLRTNIDQMNISQSYQVIRPCADIVAAAINDASEASITNSEAATVAHLMTLKVRIRQFIDINISKPDFSIDLLLQKFGISRSHLYRLFMSEGGIATYIRTRRLTLAYKQVVIQPPQGRTIAEIAYAFGFRSETVFGRAFKQFYGQTASEVRNEMKRTLPPADGAHDMTGRLWEEWITTL